MPELRNSVVIGAGISGAASAYWASRQLGSGSVILLEKENGLVKAFSRFGDKPLLLAHGAEHISTASARYARGGEQMERVLERWSGSATRDWLQSMGLTLKERPDQALYAASISELRATLSHMLDEAKVEVRFNHAVESISKLPGGGFRVWSRDGDAVEGKCLLMATGGERNHCLKLAGELGAEITPPFGGFVRLRLASTKLGERLGPIRRNVRLRCLKTGEQSSGMALLSARGFEGSAVSGLSARVCETWKNLGHRLQIEVDWMPERTGAMIRNELSSRCERGGRRAIGEDPLFGLNLKQWQVFLKAARIDADLSWSRLKAKKLQALTQRLKGDVLKTTGMGLPSEERAWAGGVSLDGVNLATGESLVTPGLYFAGEILDILGLPGGPHLDMGWGTAYLAGSAMGLAGR